MVLLLLVRPAFCQACLWLTDGFSAAAAAAAACCLLFYLLLSYLCFSCPGCNQGKREAQLLAVMYTVSTVSEPDAAVLEKQQAGPSRAGLKKGAANQQQQQQQQQAAAAKPKFQTLVFKVQVHCDGCIRKVKNAVAGIRGVETINLDVKQGRLTVSGHFDADKLLKKLAKTGKQIELATGKEAAAAAAAAVIAAAAKAGTPSAESSKQQQQQQQVTMLLDNSNSNFKLNQRLYEDHGLSTVFSDENVNGCCTM